MKDRLRSKLFNGRMHKDPEQSSQDVMKDQDQCEKVKSSRRLIFRELSEDELELVNAAGDIHSTAVPDNKLHSQEMPDN